MLNEKDIQYMRKAHEEIYKHRTKEDVKVVYKVDSDEEDAFGNKKTEEVVFDAEAVVTHSSNFTNLDRITYTGYVYEHGDIKFDIDEEFVPVSLELPEYILYHGKKYIIHYGKPKGIGERNRMEFVGRVES